MPVRIVYQCLECVRQGRLLTLVRRVVSELALGRVYYHSHEEIAAVDEDLGTQERLPEVETAKF